MNNVTEELVRQNGNQAAAVMADYAGGGGEQGEKPWLRVQVHPSGVVSFPYGYSSSLIKINNAVVSGLPKEFGDASEDYTELLDAAYAALKRYRGIEWNVLEYDPIDDTVKPSAEIRRFDWSDETIFDNHVQVDVMLNLYGDDFIVTALIINPEAAPFCPFYWGQDSNEDQEAGIPFFETTAFEVARHLVINIPMDDVTFDSEGEATTEDTYGLHTDTLAAIMANGCTVTVNLVYGSDNEVLQLNTVSLTPSTLSAVFFDPAMPSGGTVDSWTYRGLTIDVNAGKTYFEQHDA